MSSVGPRPEEEIITISRKDSDPRVSYVKHDQSLNPDDENVRQNIDGYTYNDKEYQYPVMTQGPWVVADDEDRERDELGFTNVNLHRRLDVKFPDDELEVTPREYKVNLMNVNSYRTTKKNYHLDYQELEAWKQDPDNFEMYQAHSEEIDSRAEDMEEREIP